VHFLYFLADDLCIFFISLSVFVGLRVQEEEDVGVLHVKLGRNGFTKENRPCLLESELVPGSHLPYICWWIWSVVDPTENLALMQEENDLHGIDVLILPG